MKKINFGAMALDFLTTGKASPTAYGVVYRKGKVVGDVIEAVKKAKNPKYGRAKTEFEISWLALSLSGIFKHAPSNANGAGAEPRLES